ncbi:MAG TPA: AAA family ATPase [Thermoanaerobaculia bacterium]|nr:AAA family ATPase [Thermoanaerobaculia bacterium]
MIVEEVRLRNWRGVRGSRTFRFDEGINLLVGPNEAGKSTVFEAMVRALFDRHTSKAAAICEVQPLGSSLGPEVQLQLVTANRRYRVVKRFLHDPISELWVERGGEMELDHEGDRADEELRQLLGSAGAKRGVTQAHERGLAQALWYLQRDEAIPRGEWSEALREGLSGLMKLSLRTPLQDSVLEAIEAEHAATWTRTGRLKKKSELAQLSVEVPALEEELAARREEMARAERYRRELAALASRAETHRAALTAAREELEQLDEILAEAPAVEERHRVCRERAAEAMRARDELVAVEKRIATLRARIERAQAERTAADDAEARLKTAARDHRRTAEVHARRWEEDLEPKLAALRSQIEELRSKVRLEQLEEEEKDLAARMERRGELEKRLAEAERALADGGGPSAAEWQGAARLEERRRALETRTRATAPSVTFHLEPGLCLSIGQETVRRLDPAAAPVAAEPPLGRRNGELPAGDPTPPRDPTTQRGGVPHRGDDTRPADEAPAYLVTGEATFQLKRPGGAERDGVGASGETTLAAVTIRPGDHEVAEWDRRARAAEAELQGILARFDSSDLGALERQRAERQAREARREELAARLLEVGEGAAGGLVRRLAELRGEIASLRAKAPQAVLPGLEGWAESRAAEQIAELERREQRLRKQLRDEREAEHAADAAYRKEHEQLVAASQRSAALRSTESALRDQLGEALERFGSREALAEALAKAREVVEEREREAVAAREEHEKRVATPRRRRAEVEKALTGLERERRALESERADRMARIEEVAALSLDARIGDLEGRLTVTRRRLAVVERRAVAARVLQRLAENRLQRRAGELVAPVAELVNGWLERLTGKAYRGLALDENLVPVDLKVSRYEEALPLSSLSYGTYEQVVVLLRLAIGVLLSGEERQLVVLDDRLVNADAQRMGRLREILAEAGERCQVLIATCREGEYEGLAGRALRLGEVVVPAGAVREVDG